MKRDFELDVLGAVNLGGIENVKLPDPYLLDHYTRRKDRSIFLNTAIDSNFVDIYQDILSWNKEDAGVKIEDRKPIKIYINTIGGELPAVLTIIDLILMSKTPVYTIGLGMCYSSGGLLLMAGHKRMILPSCTVLIHDGRGGALGDTGKVLDNLEFSKDTEAMVKAFVLSHTSISEEVYDKNYRRDWFIFANEAIKLGIADSIVTDINEII